MTPDHEKLTDLLWSVWKGIPTSYKSRYRTSIWQQFEDSIRSASYTNKLSAFFDKLCLKLQSSTPQRDASSLASILNAANDKQMLKLLREDAKLLIVMLQLRNQERREEWKARKAEKEVQEKAMDDPLFGLPREET